jgi:hypothetical protein
MIRALASAQSLAISVSSRSRTRRLAARAGDLQHRRAVAISPRV